jgi:hypothetical protein
MVACNPQHEIAREQVVLMNSLASAFAILRHRLQEEVAATPWPSPEAGFLDHLCPRTAPMRTVVTHRLDETPILAAMGYQYANPQSVRPSGYDDEWARYFRRLSQRQACPIDRESYFYRPLDLLGICIGAKLCPVLTAHDRQWLQEILRQGEKRLAEYSRAHYLGAVAAWHLGIIWRTNPPPRLLEAPLATLSLIHWLVNQETLAASIQLHTERAELETAILNRAFTAREPYDDLADAGLILYATQEVVDRTIQARVAETWEFPTNREGAEALVRHICDRFSVVAKALRDRHEDRETIVLNDEYDVQDLLRALLMLHFDDVRPEEWTPSYAGHASRMDFLLKPEQVVIEAKMTRHNLGQKEITNQLAVDILRYQAHQDCKTLICFVHDPTGKCSHPAALENVLTKNHGDLRVVVIVRPKEHPM